MIFFSTFPSSQELNLSTFPGHTTCTSPINTPFLFLIEVKLLAYHTLLHNTNNNTYHFCLNIGTTANNNSRGRCSIKRSTINGNMSNSRSYRLPHTIGTANTSMFAYKFISKFLISLRSKNIIYKASNKNIFLSPTHFTSSK